MESNSSDDDDYNMGSRGAASRVTAPTVAADDFRQSLKDSELLAISQSLNLSATALSKTYVGEIAPATSQPLSGSESLPPDALTDN